MSAPEELRAEILRFIARGIVARPDADAFERLALAVFAYQFTENEPYRRYCERRHRLPESVECWADIPAVPTAAFKERPLVCGDPGAVEAVFRTSGTTQGQERRGAHYVPDLALYRASALPNFRAHLLPEYARLPMLILGPNPDLAPDSSLTWMMECVRSQYGSAGSEYYVDAGGLCFERLVLALNDAEATGRPVLILGTAMSFAHLFDIMGKRGRSYRLPAGSRVMETGGFKGRQREIPRERLYKMLTERLGLSEFYCVAEYGMTEMCSQFYDNVLAERARGRASATRYKVVPPWVRTQVVDAETLEPLPPGRIGVLRHFDMANLDSVMAIQTDDLGVAGDDGFEILGRAAASELRGCSIAMDQWLTAQR
jgi:hypothetical protein